VTRLLVLGSTGSIGESTLAVVRAMPETLRVTALCCARNVERLALQAREFAPEAVGIAEESAAAGGLAKRGVKIYRGTEGIVRMIEETGADIAVNGISGAPGLLPSFAAVRSGKDLALANKESLVMAGPLLLAEAKRGGRSILPVDSEHAALFSILRSLDPGHVAELVITASGGAFRDLPAESLSRVTFQDALRHPTWKMGPKITVDSATMANKGLEVIEAHRLFAVPLERIRVLIHPQSLVHSLVRTIDGTLHAQASTADMRIPIQNALTFPAVSANRVEWLDLGGKSLSFFAVDRERYRMLGLAYRAAELSLAHPIAYNAANEVAVAAFMAGAIPFMGIPDLVERTLSMEWGPGPSTVEEVLEVDAAARAKTREFMG
jgi:1-deoxy-D-xylulose-5-phosphate reductoisomerase